MKIAITGGAGFIGRKLISVLLRGDPTLKIKVLDSFDPQVHSADAELSFCTEFKSAELRVGSVANQKDVEWLLSDSTVLIHLAAETGTGQSMYSLHKYTDTNVTGTATLIEEILRTARGLDRIILASSRSVYGEGQYGLCEKPKCPENPLPAARCMNDLSAGVFDVKCKTCGTPRVSLPTRETCPPAPLSYYALTKSIQEQQFAMYESKICRALTTFRLQNVYGPGQSLSNPYTGILAIFSSLAKNGHSINVFEDGEESRDFVHVRDVVECIISAVYACDDRVLRGVYNVGTGVRVAVKEVAKLINDFYGRKSSIRVSGDFRVGDIRHNYADTTKLKEAGIDSARFTPFEDGLKEFLLSTQYKESDIANKLSKSFDEMAASGMFISGKS